MPEWHLAPSCQASSAGPRAPRLVHRAVESIRRRAETVSALRVSGAPRYHYKWGRIPNPMPFRSRTATYPANTVGRTPRSAADAPVGLAPAGDGWSHWATSGSRGTRADLGVRPTQPTAVTELASFRISRRPAISDPASRAKHPAASGLPVHGARPDWLRSAPSLTGRARNRPPLPPRPGPALQPVELSNTHVEFYISACNTLIRCQIIAILNIVPLIISTCRFVVKNNTPLPA